ncbi:MAG TPA: sensor histidine kinase [Candidatus Nitrosotalea sp.]|nr:sensor histidine kinase [Candidatus Nitrosotalea sp.]
MRPLAKFLVTWSLIGVLIIGVTIYLTEAIIQYQTEEIKRNKENQVKILADDAYGRINNLASAIRATSDLDIFSYVHDTDKISNPLHGIPQSAEQEKRAVADNLLTEYKELDYLFFLLPDGQMYFLEPYSQQVNLTQNNFSFRDYYKGVTETKTQYLSEVYTSNNNGHPVVAIATPVYAKDHSMIGTWVGALNLKAIDDSLGLIHLGTNVRIVYVDQHGQIAADSSNGTGATTSSFANLPSYQDGLAGNSGTVLENVGGTQMFVAYTPMSTLGNTWVIMSMQPYDDAFSAVISSQNLLVVTIVIFLSILAISGFYVYRRDVQKLHLLERIREAETAKDEFSAMVTHELKTPLFTISGYSEMLEEPGLVGNLNKEQLDAVTQIHESARRLEHLISDILAAQKLDLNRMKFNKMQFDVGEFMNGIVQTYSAVTKEKEIDFKNSTKDTIAVETDKDRLSQVFDNLIGNSIDFVPEKGGVIEIGAKSANQHVEFFVKDNGAGIPKAKQDQLFKKFYQVDSSLKRRHGGTGLGLVICKGIVEALGGKIWFESEPGRGTTFWFSIPATT